MFPRSRLSLLVLSSLGGAFGRFLGAGDEEPAVQEDGVTVQHLRGVNEDLHLALEELPDRTVQSLRAAVSAKYGEDPADTIVLMARGPREKWDREYFNWEDELLQDDAEIKAGDTLTAHVVKIANRSGAPGAGGAASSDSDDLADMYRVWYGKV